MSISIDTNESETAGTIEFDNGVVSFSTYSYYIDSFGDDEIDKEQTKQLYKEMKKYYEGEK